MEGLQGFLSGNETQQQSYSKLNIHNASDVQSPLVLHAAPNLICIDSKFIPSTHLLPVHVPLSVLVLSQQETLRFLTEFRETC